MVRLHAKARDAAPAHHVADCLFVRALHLDDGKSDGSTRRLRQRPGGSRIAGVRDQHDGFGVDHRRRRGRAHAGQIADVREMRDKESVNPERGHAAAGAGQPAGPAVAAGWLHGGNGSSTLRS